MQIQRDKLFEAFATFAEAGSGVVVGPPGVGKTVLLRTFCDESLSGRPDCLYLPVDKLGITNEKELEAAVGIETDFIQQLKSTAPVDRRGILAIDALDAARSEVAKRFFLNLIAGALKSLSESWNVIVSVRTYDAIKSQELQDLFPRKYDSVTPVEFQNPSIYCRHFAIPELSYEESEQAIASIPTLPSIYENSSPDFKKLLRIPFNIWLVEKILASDPESIEFSSAYSEIQLLGLFWKYRVTNDSLREERQVLLSRVARAMVEDRSLSVRNDKVYPTGAQATWASLLTAEVFATSEDGQRILFYHNILFDYAVSVLLMEDELQHLADFLTEDPSRTLFLRPSLNFYFTRLWHGKRELFWNISFGILSDSSLHVRLFARLIPPAVVINEAREFEDLEPLIQALSNGDAVAVEAVKRVLQAYRMLDPARIDPWIIFFISVSYHLSYEFAWDLAIVTNQALGLAQREKVEILEVACGSIARNILAWVLHERSSGDTSWFDHLGAVWGIPLVAQTYGTDSIASEMLLDQILAFLKEPAFSITYFHRLAEFVTYIWDYSPEFVERVYLEIFTHQESSEEKTSFGTPVVPMTSTRRQDFKMCRYVLAHEFPKLLKAKPVEATRVVLKTLNEYIFSEQVGRYKSYIRPRDPSLFEFRGGSARYLRDHSYLWDNSLSDDALELGGHLFHFVSDLASSGNSQVLNSILDEFRDSAEAAFFWKRLLDVGTRFPEIFAGLLFELCVAEPILLGSDTEAELQEFIEIALRYFSIDQQMGFEQVILRVAETSGRDKDFLESWKRRLVARIPKDLLKLEETKAIRQQMDDAGNVPHATPRFAFNITATPVTEESWFEEQGIDLEKTGNKDLVSLVIPLKDFNARLYNETPSVEDIKAVLDPAKALYARLGVSTGTDAAVIESVWTELAMCVVKMSKGIQDANSEEFHFCKEVLLIASEHPLPLPNEEFDSSYSSPSWSSAPRTEAAQGLPWLGRLSLDKEILAAIEKLVDDPKPSVRFLVVSELIRFFETSPEGFWELAHRVVSHEQNKVVQEAMFRNLSYTAIKDDDKTVKIFQQFFSRPWRDLNEIRIWSSAVPTIVGLAFVRQNSWCVAMIDRFLDDPLEKTAPIGSAIYNCIPFISSERLRNSDNLLAAERAVEWMIRAVGSISNGISSLVSKNKGGDLSQDVYYENLKTLYHILDDLVLRLYFTAKTDDRQLAYDEKPISDEERRNYYFRIKPLLERIIEFATGNNGFLFAPTAYHFMQLLSGILSYDPKGAINMAASVARSSESFSYTIDAMAVTQMVDMVERILADFRVDVREGQPLEDLLTLLDLFAATGDSSALRLVWRLDEIYR